MTSDMVLAAVRLESTADRVRNQLCELIVSGALEPGRPLTEKDVADQLGVSRSPVREAFQELVAERLLVAEHNRSVTVKQFTAQDITEIYDARIAIETHAAGVVIKAGPQQVEQTVELLQNSLEQLRAALQSGGRVEISEADLAFHQQLVRCGGNSRLTDAYLLLSAETVTCMTRLEVAHPSGAELIQDHQDFIDALRTGDPDQSARVIAQHLDLASTKLANFSLPEESHPRTAAPPAR